ncbi:Peptidoglycan/xylan/chitin deacetylase, PgdA/CDA1 family [Actinopolymorpha cephalotaxi]|uniref:Peptidoglycan/xylan/chitin deacetylase (PgdA/CDA1 family) n=1 Tax=Actinopolymorpha cephalotaxi TaxID=504797 RepID=A0A1I2X040_9ACTN|nr:polysaccharide deacetylase family protein [Actinopolymorpha cephalotaxi]NYH85203.1 peptidoglycan/xylan/chitin deacetylase (PgdA/CDA1 family) [Actinopolymorpha cephalotaxi]SFH06377.1 Peptidoglycan/xylan/chitin deacetylase, PgdA/CDA1 family [Actinopolymorpha cephalotaxi]
MPTESRKRGLTVTSATGAGVALVAAGVVAEFLPTVTAVSPVRRLCPTLAGRGDPGHVALTFDDGPHPVATPTVLRRLDELAVRATFFLLAEQVREHPRVAYETHERGHEIAVHGLRHDPPTRPWRAGADLAEAYRTIADVTGASPGWYRPPYGVLTTSRAAAARRLGLRPVLWTADGRDWVRDADGDTVARRVLSRVDGGGTILLHDSDVAAVPGSWRSALDALDAVVGHCRTQGRLVGPLRDHGLRN